MKRIIPLLLLFVVSCKQKLLDVPKDVIPMETMKVILADMHVADAVAETKTQVGANEKELVQKYDEQIFKIHGTTREAFAKSFSFYEQNPVLLNLMYDDILNDLSKREGEISKK